MKAIQTTIILLLISMSIQSQDYKRMMDDYSINFYDVIAEANRHFEAIDKTEKGSGWKPFQRWIEANEYKYYPDGDRSLVDHYLPSKAYNSFKKNNPPTNRNLFADGWSDLGPYSIDSITGHYAAGLGRIEDFCVYPLDSDIIYIGSRSGGLWKTMDGGNTWTGGSTDFLPASGVNALTVSPTNSDSVLINVRNAQNGTSHGIYRSADGGTTWNETNFNPINLGVGGLGSNFQIDEITMHPSIPNLIFVATSQGLYKSTDNLNTWAQVIVGNWVTEIVFHPNNADKMYAFWRGASNQLMISDDQGSTFLGSGPLNGNNGSTVVEISTSLGCPQCVYVGTNNGLWKSVDEGLSFNPLTDPGGACHGFATNDIDTSILIYGYVDLFGSSNGGQDFDQITYWSLGNTNGSGNGHQNSFNTSTDYIHADTRDLECLNGIFYVVTDGLFAKSTDNGTTWDVLSSNIGIRENYRLGLSQSNQGRTICGSQDNGTSIKHSTTWIEFYGADGMEGLIHPLNDDYMLGSVQYGGRRQTKNGGQSQTGATPNGSTGANWLAPLAYDPNDQMTIYDFRDTLYKSEDFADSHIKLGTPSFSGDIQNAAIAENNSNIILVSRGANIEKSIDSGMTFQNVRENLPNYSIQDIAFDPRDDNTYIVVYGRYQNDGNKVFITTDGGSSYNNITSNLGDMPIRSVVIDHTPERNIYLGAEIGLYTKAMSDVNWVLYNDQLPNVSVRELEINYGSNTLRGVTWGRGLWENHLLGRSSYPAIIATKITDQPTEEFPKQGAPQVVTSKIHYEGTLSSVYVAWSIDSLSFDHVISMTNSMDSTWVTNSPLPNAALSEKVYFKVFAIGGSQDTSETYKFEFEYKDICEAEGSIVNGNLFINSMTFGTFQNTSGNDTFTFYSNNVIPIQPGQSYGLTTNANTGWAENDHAVWIDYNKNLDFTPDEAVMYDPNSGAQSLTNVLIPNTIQENDTLRMRVRLSYWGSTPSPCGITLGEVEDYLLVVPDVCKTVDNTKDNGPGSLRAAIGCAQEGDTITFSPALYNDTIFINTSAIFIKESITIMSDTGNHIRIASSLPHDISRKHAFQIEANKTIEFNGFAIDGAFGLEGSGILNAGILTLHNMIITKNGKEDVTSVVENLVGGSIFIKGKTKIE